MIRKFEVNITTLNSAENEILNNIVTATERGDRGKCHIGFPSQTFQNPEEGGNNLRNVGFWIKNIVIIISLFYFIQCEAWVKYCNRSRDKRDFKGSSGKDCGTHELN